MNPKPVHRAAPAHRTRWHAPWSPALVVAVAVGMAAPPAATRAADTTPGVSFVADPMRPAMPATARASTAPAATAPRAVEALVDDRGLPRLEATHRSASGRRAALLDGRWRTVGEAVGGLRVAAVGEADVVLTRGDERITLSLLTVRTRPSTPARDADPRPARGATP